MSRRLRAILLVVTLTLVVAAQLVALRLAPRQLRLHDGGRDVTATLRVVTLDGSRRSPRPGDLVWLDDSWMFVRDGGDRTKEEMKRVALTVTEDPEPREAFLRLTRAELGELWGLELRAWDDEIAAQVGRLDLSRTCVTLHGETVRSSGALARLPEGLRYLATDDGAKLDGLARFETTLRFLALEASLEEDRRLPALPALQALVIANLPYGSTFTTQGFSELRSLEAECEWNVVPALEGSPKLRHLVLRRFAIGEIPDLAKLPELTTLDLRGSSVRTIPLVAFPYLEEANLLATDVSDADVLALQEQNPSARILSDPAALVADALGRATLLRVRAGPAHCDEPSGRVLFEETDLASVREVAAHLEVLRETWRGACAETPRIEAWAGDELIASLAIHGDRTGVPTIAWHDVIPTDLILTPESAQWLGAWLARHGVTQDLTAVPCVTALAFSPQGDRLASVGTDGSLRLFRTEELLRGTPRPERELVARVTTATAHHRSPHPNPRYPVALTDVHFAPDVTEIAARDVCREITVWSLATGQVVPEPGDALSEHPAYAAFVFPPPRPRRSLIGGSAVDVSDPVSGVRLWAAYFAANDPDRKAWVVNDVLVAVYEAVNGTVSFRDIETGAVLRCVPVPGPLSHVVEISADGRFLALAHENSVRVVDLGKD